MPCESSSPLRPGAAVHGRRAPAQPRLGCKRSRSPPSAFACSSAGEPGPPESQRRRWDNPNVVTRRFQPFPKRQWVEADDATLADINDEDMFKLMSYNILGENNARNHPDLYWSVPHDALKWEFRRRLVCSEIVQLNPDLLCLQEVDRFENVMMDLKKKGYGASFKGRGGDAKDGCATFWKEERVHLLDEDSIDFNAFDLRNNVAQLFVFQLNGTQRIVVGNIHVLFNPKRGDIKLGQIRMLLEKANNLSTKWGGIPIVLAGDFNSTPESAVYDFVSAKQLDVTLHDRRHLSGLEKFEPYFQLPSNFRDSWGHKELRNATGHSEGNVVAHPLMLRSSYATIKGTAGTRGPKGEPAATSSHKKFLGTVDYIWYTSGLVCTRVLDTLPIDVLKKTRLPTKVIGSDHLCLLAEFGFAPCNKDEQKDEPSQDTSTSLVEGSSTPSDL